VSPKRKDAKNYKFIGKATKRIDSLEKSTGKAEFGIDVRLPGMLHAAVARCPVFGGTVKSFDAKSEGRGRGKAGGADIERRRGSGGEYLVCDGRAQCAGNHLG
jgi:CO/xanthine dehydrogenase Mo-binding subunit